MLTMLALFIGAVAGVVLLEGMIRRTLVGVAGVLGIHLVETVLGASLAATVGLINVTANDVLFTLLTVASVARLLRGGRLTVVQWLLVIFGLVAAFSMLRGAAAFGPDTAINDFRKVYYLVSGALYCSTATPTPAVMRRMGWLLLGTSAAMLALAILRWGFLFAGLPVGRYASGGPLRVLDSGGALLLAQGFFIAAGQRRLRTAPPLLRALVPAFVLAVLLVQHRSVWVVMIVTLAVFATHDHQLGRRLVAFVAVGTLACVASVVYVFDSDEFTIAEQITESATNPDTFAWRVEGWTSLFVDAGPQTATEHLVGLPFGTGWDRRVGGSIVEVSPHNYYIETYLRMGAIGLALLLAIGWKLWRGLSAHSDVHETALLSDRVLLLLLVTLAVYYIPYHPLPTHGIVLGLIAAAASRATRLDDRSSRTAVESPATVGQ